MHTYQRVRYFLCHLGGEYRPSEPGLLPHPSHPAMPWKSPLFAELLCRCWTRQWMALGWSWSGFLWMLWDGADHFQCAAQVSRELVPTNGGNATQLGRPISRRQEWWAGLSNRDGAGNRPWTTTVSIINTHYKRDILKYVCQILPQVEHPKLPDTHL